MIISTTRMEYFSDGIIAIAITIMVLDIELTNFAGITLQTEWAIFAKLLPRFLIYLLSFISVGIMWVNHHTLYHVIQYVNAKLLWHNLHLLFWLTLVPFSTSIMAKYPLLPVATATYGLIMFMVSLGFALSRRYGLKQHLALGAGLKELNDVVQKTGRIKQMKAKISMGLYITSISLSFVYTPLVYICFIASAILFFLPDEVKNKRLAKILYNEIKEVHG